MLKAEISLHVRMRWRLIAVHEHLNRKRNTNYDGEEWADVSWQAFIAGVNVPSLELIFQPQEISSNGAEAAGKLIDVIKIVFLSASFNTWGGRRVNYDNTVNTSRLLRLQFEDRDVKSGENASSDLCNVWRDKWW